MDSITIKIQHRVSIGQRNVARLANFFRQFYQNRVSMTVLSSYQAIREISGMKNTSSLYSGYRYSPEIISHAVWLYHRFCVSFREVEDLLAKRGVTVSYESIRNWCRKFGSTYTQSIKKRRGRLGDSWYLDEV